MNETPIEKVNLDNHPVSTEAAAMEGAERMEALQSTPFSKWRKGLELHSRLIAKCLALILRTQRYTLGRAGVRVARAVNQVGKIRYVQREGVAMYVGMILYGFCSGYFGRDSYEDKRVEAVGIDWVVAREIREEGLPEFAYFKDRVTLERLCQEWSVKPPPSER